MIRVLLDELNDRPLKKLGVSRRALYEQLDRPALQPLPATRRGPITPPYGTARPRHPCAARRRWRRGSTGRAAIMENSVLMLDTHAVARSLTAADFTPANRSPGEKR